MPDAISLSDARILVIDDDENNRIILTRLLGMAGASRDRVLAIEGAPSRFLRSEGSWDLVLLDIQMPDQDGYEVLEELRSDRGGFLRAKIAALTANAMPDDIARVRSAGFDGFIGKPVDARRLGPAIEAILNGNPSWIP